MPLRGSFLYEFFQACAIYRSDVGLAFAQSRISGRLPLVGTAIAQGRDRDRALLISLHRLSLGGLLSSRARLRFAGCVQSCL